MQKCNSCGVEKDIKILELYPYPDEDCICDDPVPPLFEIDCQPTTKGQEWRNPSVCHECFHRLSPDMWINQKMWESLNPVVPFAELPLLKREI